MIMNMKKMLCYMLSSVFLLAILNSCGDDDDKPAAPAAPTLADLAGDYTGDSELSIIVGLATPVSVTSPEADDGATVVFKNDDDDNLEITVTDAQLKVTGGTAVDVDGEFTFTVDRLTRENEDPIAFDIDDTGSVDITVGSGATAVSIDGLALTDVDATKEAQDEIVLTAKATLTKVQADALIGAFVATSPPAAPAGVDVTIRSKKTNNKGIDVTITLNMLFLK